MQHKNRRPSIALIDDHSIVRKALVNLVEAFNEFNVIYDVTSFSELQEKLFTKKTRFAVNGHKNARKKWF